MFHNPGADPMEEIDTHCLAIARKVHLLDKTGLLSARMRLKELIQIVESIYNLS